MINILFCIQYDDLCEVFTDKLVAKIPSTASGTVTAINFGDDAIAPVGHTLITIETDAGSTETVVAAPVAEPEPEVPAAVPDVAVPTGRSVINKAATAPPGKLPGKALSTPAVRFLAKKEGIDIN